MKIKKKDMVIKRSFIAFLLVFFWTHWSGSAKAESCTLSLTIEGAIGPASLDFLQRAQEKARKDQCSSIFMRINTPGGNLQTTRIMVEEILNSDRPFLCLIAPAGGHAGSAGAIIMQACHVSGALEATNIGAATPVTGGGDNIGEDMRKKMINDTQSWVEGLAKLRGRNVDFAKEIINEAKAVDAEEAAKIGAIDFVVSTQEEFLQKARGKEVSLRDRLKGEVAVGDLRLFEPGMRYELLQIATDPQFAYMIFMGSLGLLYFELTQPGLILPGVLGGIGLVISMVSFHKLNVDWAGVLLILLGIVLMLAEAFVPSFGALGAGGMGSFILGSVLLYDPERTGVSLPLGTLIIPALILGSITFYLARIAYKNFSGKKRSLLDEFDGQVGQVVEVKERGRNGLVEINGETWKFEAEVPVKLGDSVTVKEQKGLTLKVAPEKN